MAVFTSLSRRARRATAVVAGLLLVGAAPCLAGTTVVDDHGRPVATKGAPGGAVDYTRPGPVRRVAAGELEGVTPDSRAVVVADVGSSGQQPPGCDYLWFSQLFVAPLDGGPRRPMHRDGGDDVYGTLVSGPGSRVAVAEECDGDVAGLTVAAQTGSGDLHDTRRVPMQQQFPASGWVSDFSTSGNELLGMYPEDSKDPKSRFVAIAIAIDSGKVTELGRGAIDMVAGQPGGRLVISEGGRVTVRDGDRHAVASATGRVFRLAPDHRRVAVVDGGRLSVLNAEGDTTTVAEEPAGWDIIDVTWAPDGSAVAYAAVLADAHGLDDESRINVVTLGPRPAVTSMAHSAHQLLLHPVFSPDGRTLAYEVIDTGENSDGKSVWASTFPEGR